MPLNKDPFADEIRRHLSLLRQHWTVLALTTGLALAAAALYHYSIEPEYVAEAKLIVERNPRRAARVTDIGVAWHGMTYELQVLSSLDLARKTAQYLAEVAIHERHPNPTTWQRIQRRVLGRPLPVDHTPAQPITPAALRERVEVDPVPESNIARLGPLLAIAI